MSDRALRFTGNLSALSSEDQRLLFERASVRDNALIQAVGGIVERVREQGDDALIELAGRFDKVKLTGLSVSREAMKEALDSLDRGVRRAMEQSARNIARVHRAFLPRSTTVKVARGVTVTRRPDPLERVGVYAPGGSAAYPSSVLMGVIPARIAGVSEVILCSPPQENGVPSNAVLAAAELAGVDKVFAVGGAGAIAAMAFGTKTIPRVDKIVGPGNAYVAEAKLQLAGVTAFDSPAGPSELVVIADETADPALIAREVVAQAEHDARAVAVVFASGDGLSDSISSEIASAVDRCARRDIIKESLANRGGVLAVADTDEALVAANRFAPEHLLLAVANAKQTLERVRNAGTVFVGAASSVSFGDYITGANHVLPTGGLARSYSGLSTLDFIRWTTFQTIDVPAAKRLARDTVSFAEAEGLFAHAEAARAWVQRR